MTTIITEDEETVALYILDTNASDECELTATRREYLRSSNGYLLVFALNDRASFENIIQYINMIHKYNSNPSIVLVATKLDLEHFEREVSIDEARNFATEVHLPLIETSALCGTNVDLAFHTIVRRRSVGEKNRSTADCCLA